MPTPSESLTSAQSQASVFRLLTWNATIPLEIRLARDSLPRDTQVDQIHVADADEAVDGEEDEEEGLPRYYMQVTRHTYLPLLIPEINEIFVSSITTSSEREEDGQGAGSKRGSGTDGWWFEVEWVGRKGKRQRETCKWHWSLDLIQLYTSINSPPTSSAHHHQHRPDGDLLSSSVRSSPLRLILHLKPRQTAPLPAPTSSTTTTTSTPPPPVAPMLSNSIETCRIAFISLLKEADYVRWGNTRRVTGLRRVDLEGAWEGVVENNYETHARFMQKVVPLPLPVPAGTTTKPNPKNLSSSSSAPPPPTKALQQQQPPENLGATTSPDSCYAVRSVPLKLYPSNNTPEVQDIVNPLNSNGEPKTLIQFLRQTLPLLFPTTDELAVYALATPIMYGVVLPPEADVAWLAACVCAPDGWLRIGIKIA